MAYWLGLAFLAGAVAFVVNALRYRTRARAELARLAARGETPRSLHPSLSILADAAPALVAFFLFAAGALTVVAFFAVGAQRFLSLFDLFGYLAFLASYGFWLNVKTTYRITDFVGAPASAQADLRDAAS
ncbi:MAG: hypothetical protein KJS97_13865 [Alphaproteobacteria bacterium]|nr:hypothetical protein [Alphaproteobacteria bacterium]